MNRNELQFFFKGKLEEYLKIDTTIQELYSKLNQVNAMTDDSLIQLNMGLAIFSVSKETAQGILNEAIAVEENYHKLMSIKFDKAVKVLRGEE